jgi:hypothetical protein
MKFILTIDTEADNQWSHGIPVTTNNISCIPSFQELCDRYQITPTYLVTSEVCEDKKAVTILKEIQDKGHCEIGSHLHTWTTPPFQEAEGLRYNDKHHAFANEIPGELFEQKLSHLTNQVKKSFGHSPVSFRSGRYGFVRSMAGILTKYGYTTDSSITPHRSWKSTPGLPDGNGGPDFIMENNFPSTINTENGKLLEIPVTILYTKALLKSNPGLAKFITLNQNKYLNKFLSLLNLNHQPLWLRPLPYTAVEDLKKIICTAEETGLKYVVMMFHSSELMPGGSPYWKDKDGVADLISKLTDFFHFLESRSIVSLKLCDVCNEQLE